MARVTFTERYDHRPSPNVWITYYAEKFYPDVPRSAADDAIAKGKAWEQGPDGERVAAVRPTRARRPKK